MDNSANNSRIAKNTFFLYGRMAFVLLISLYTTRAILNALGVVDFGIYNVVAGFVTMFAFINSSMTNGIQRFYNYTIGENDDLRLVRVYNTSLQIQLTLAIIVVFLLETIGLWYVYNKMVIPSERFSTALWLYQFSIVSLVFVIIQIPYSASIIAHEKMGFFAMVSIIDAVAKLIIALLLPYINSDKLLFYGIYTLGVSVANFLLYYIYSKKHFNEIILQMKYSKDLFCSMITFSGWNIFGTFAFMLRSQGLTVLLNFFFGAIVNAAQGVAAQIQSAIQGFSQNIVTSFRPQMIQSYAAGDNERVAKMFFSLSKISYLMLFMLSVPVSVEIGYILQLWLGETIPEYTPHFTILVLANMVLLSLHTPIVTIIHASGKMKKFQLVTGFITCSIIPISWVALKLGCEPGSVYWISLIVQVINQGACLKVLQDVFPYNMRDYLNLVIAPLVVISIVVITVEIGVVSIFSTSLLRLLLSCFMSVAFTGLSTYFTLTAQEKALVDKMVINKILKKKTL